MECFRNGTKDGEESPREGMEYCRQQFRFKISQLDQTIGIDWRINHPRGNLSGFFYTAFAHGRFKYIKEDWRNHFCIMFFKQLIINYFLGLLLVVLIVAFNRKTFDVILFYNEKIF